MAASKPNLAELVAKMPPTDREIEAAKKAGSPDAQAKSPQEVQPSKFTGPDPEEANRMCEQVLAGGGDSLIELIGIIRSPAEPEFQNYKAEYLLHCLTLYVGRSGKEPQRRLFIDTLAAQTGSVKLSKYVRGFLTRELQMIADKTAVAALGRLLADEDLCVDAAVALVAIGEGAAEQLRAALPAAKGKCRLTILQNLGVVRDEKSVSALQQAVRDDDLDVRLAAAWGLANIGDAQSVDLLLKAAEAEAPFERAKATQACLVLAENLAGAGKKDAAVRIYNHLRNTRTDPKEQYIREAATQALEAMGGKLT